MVLACIQFRSFNHDLAVAEFIGIKYLALAINACLIAINYIVSKLTICLNDKITESAIQCIVEKNLVGKTKILGYYDSETIRKAIEKGSVYATFTIDTKALAMQSVNALNEFNDTGYVSDYSTTTVKKITRLNLDDYNSEGDENEG